MRLTVLALFVAAPLLLASQDSEPKDTKVPAIKEIDMVKGLTPGKPGGATKPTKVSNAEELEKLVPAKENRDELLKKVDLKKQYLLVFAWAGSGGDRLSHKLDKNEVTFSYKRGLTRDLRRHLKVYALAKDTKYKVGD